VTNNYIKIVVGGRVTEIVFFDDTDHESTALAHVRARDLRKEALREASFLASKPRVTLCVYQGNNPFFN
jgi:hypothetical protein